MQFASSKLIVLFHLLLLMQFGCASAPKVSLPERPWLTSKSKLLSGNTTVFGLKFVVRASSEIAVKAGLEELRRLSSLYDAQKGSELLRINSAAYHQAVTVSTETAAILELCQKMYETSDQKFDVSFVPLRADADPSDNAVTDWDHQVKLSPNTQRYFGKQNLLWDPSTRQVRLYLRRTKLNLNGMIRGYAVQRAILAMQKANATSGAILSDSVLSAFGNELKNTSLLCLENPSALGTCLYSILPLDFTHPLFLATSASQERRGMMFDPKDTWTYRSGGVIVAGNDAAWVQFAATLTTLMGDGQLNTFLQKNFNPKIAAVFFDQNQKNKVNGSLLPFAKVKPL